MFSIILASTPDGVIGIDGKLPWHLPEDLQWFKEVTLGKRVIMGRKTFESLGNKSLPKRENVIISRAGITIDSCLKMFYNKGESFVIGGAEIYKQFFDSNMYDYVFHTTVYCGKEFDESATRVEIPFSNLIKICSSATCPDRTESLYYNHSIYRKK